MCHKLLFDELAGASPEYKRQVELFCLQRPTLGKSKHLKKLVKSLNKKRKRQGLKKLKVRNIKLETPSSWKTISFT
jgi:hypothetical protein